MKITAYRSLAAVVVGGATLIVSVLYSGHLRDWLLTEPTGTSLRQESYYQHCLVASGCDLILESGQVTLNIEPKEMPELQPLNITLKLSGMDAEKVYMTFVGRDMPMNLPSFPLLIQDEAAGVQRFKGVGNISFCTTDENMVWLARLVIKSESVITTVHFELEKE